jgi:glutamate/tyrosine decarboxylase-like PLP-dependent enzyme
MEPEDFRALGYDLVDRISDLLGSMRHRPVTAGHDPTQVRELLDAEATMPLHGGDPARILSQAAELLIRESLHNGHPRFLGYITSSAAPIGMLGDLLASAVNANVGAWVLSPVATEIEAQTVRWISELLGFGRTDGLLVSGGNMANMVAFWAARVRAAGEGIRASGTAAAGDLRVYASRETHTWIQKAADLSGLGTDAVRWIPVRDDLTMDLQSLADALDEDRRQGLRPMMVVATGGSVSTGAVDDIPGISALCRDLGIWLHVDGAYGGFAAVLPDAPEPLHHLHLADSVAVDPHKWLYAPLEAACVLVRDADALRAAFSYHPPYYHFGVEATNFVDLGPQNSRGFRALKVWLALQQAGREGYVKMIGDDVRLAGELHGAADRHPELETGASGLSITTFRFVPSDLSVTGEADREAYLDRLNRALQDRLEREGNTFLSNAVLGGRYFLRACIVNFRTEQADVLSIPDLVARAGNAVHRELSGD